MLKKYLIVTSIIFHIAIVASLFWIVPFVNKMNEDAKRWGEARQNPEIGTITDVKLLKRDEYEYKSYAVDLNGKQIYLEDISEETFLVDDQVKLSLSNDYIDDRKWLRVQIMGISR